MLRDGQKEERQPRRRRAFFKLHRLAHHPPDPAPAAQDQHHADDEVEQHHGDVFAELGAIDVGAPKAAVFQPERIEIFTHGGDRTGPVGRVYRGRFKRQKRAGLTAGQERVDLAHKPLCPAQLGLCATARGFGLHQARRKVGAFGGNGLWLALPLFGWRAERLDLGAQRVDPGGIRRCGGAELFAPIHDLRTQAFEGRVRGAFGVDHAFGALGQCRPLGIVDPGRGGGSLFLRKPRPRQDQDKGE